MADNIDIRISPALDPETYRAMEGYNESNRGFVDGVVNVFSDIYQTLGKVHDARDLWERNPAVTPENRILIVGKEGEKQKERVLKRLALAERDLRSNIKHTEGELSRPLTERAGLGSLNSEVRAHVKSLKRPEREAFMNEALERDDEATLTAVLGGQPFLSGLTQIDHEHYVRTYHVKKDPHLMARLDLMQRMLAMLERNSPVVHAQFERAIGAKPGVVAHLDRANEQALAALKIEPTV